jgi:RecJ-like exonuclease
MGSCVICGKSVDGAVCSSHEEDVAFEFRGSRPDQLVSGRFYRGAVDGFADFGVFVDIGDHVTGLLHESELDRRLESLDWESGDAVYVQVQHVHDNGNVDLTWSIRQSPREFRGQLVHDPGIEGGTKVAEESAEPASAERRAPDADADTDEEGEEGNGQAAEADGESAASDTENVADTEEVEDADDDHEDEATEEVEDADDDHEDEATEEVEDADDDHEDEASAAERVPVADLADRVGERVRVEGRIEGINQTGGPTIFVVTDEAGTVDCAAFDGAGVRAYPELAVDDVVAVVGEVERRQGAIQVESESVERLDGADREAVEGRLDDALDERAEPADTTPLAPDPAVEDAHESLVDVATEIRRAVIESRPVIVRHTATVDGYVAGAAIECAVLPLVREHHDADDAEYHFVDRRPLEDPFYDVSAATGDASDMLEDAARHDEKHPLFVLADAGSTRESAHGLDLLAAYDAPRVVVDGDAADAEIEDRVDALAATPGTTTAVLAATVAAAVNPDVRGDVGHLPAVSYWEGLPDAYADLAATAGYESGDVADLRAAVALEAYYQSYEDKREIIQDLLWGEGNRALADHIAGQFREKLETELATVDAHVERRDLDGASLSLLDAAAFTHRFDFPPTTLLLDALHRQERDREGPPHVTVVVDEAELRVRSTEPVDIRNVGEAVAEQVPDAGVRARGSHDGRIEFLKGERVDAIDATVAALGDRVAVGNPVED